METPLKPPKLEKRFGQMISQYMELCTRNFGGATWRSLRQMHPKLWQQSLLSDFSYLRTRAAVALRLKASVLDTQVSDQI